MSPFALVGERKVEGEEAHAHGERHEQARKEPRWSAEEDERKRGRGGRRRGRRREGSSRALFSAWTGEEEEEWEGECGKGGEKKRVEG